MSSTASSLAPDGNAFKPSPPLPPSKHRQRRLRTAAPSASCRQQSIARSEPSIVATAFDATARCRCPDAYLLCSPDAAADVARTACMHRPCCLTATARPKLLRVDNTLACRRGRGTITAAHADDQCRMRMLRSRHSYSATACYSVRYSPINTDAFNE
ncbi:hypothetical protein ACLOJK_034364 [Asimina triloba]